MTSQTLLAYTEAGLGIADQWVTDATDFLLRAQKPDGGFPTNRRAGSDTSSTAIAIQALMTVSGTSGTEAVVHEAVTHLDAGMISDGNYTIKLVPTGDDAYDLVVETGYIVDCSPRGYEFWGDAWDDTSVAVMDVADIYGNATNMTVVLRIDRERLAPPTNKQKVAIALSHDQIPDEADWWIVSAGNTNTSGGGKLIDWSKFEQVVEGAYTYLTITNLEVPEEYDIFGGNDWLVVIVGDDEHPIKDNPGRGYLVGYYNSWIWIFDYRNLLAWRPLDSPAVERLCLDLDRDQEFDDKRLSDGDSLKAEGLLWEAGIGYNQTDLNISFYQPDLNITRWYYPVRYNLSSIPDSASGLYHFGVMSVENKPSLSRDYKVVLRDSVEEGEYDEAYIWNGTHWNFYPDGSTWNENGTLWIIGVEEDFLTLTRNNPISMEGITGPNTTSLIVEGDFIKIDVESQGQGANGGEIWLTLHYGSKEVNRAILGGSAASVRQVFGTWGDLRQSSKAYHALALAEDWFTDKDNKDAADLAHKLADLCQQTIKFNKAYNSVIEDKFIVQAWYKSEMR